MADGTATMYDHRAAGRREAGSAPETWVESLVGWTAAVTGSPNIITPVGVHASIGAASEGGTTKHWNVWTTNHAISGFESLFVPDLDDEVTESEACTTGPNTFCDLEEYATVAGDMTGDIRAAAPAMDWQVRAVRSVADSDHDYSVELRFYHRTSGGTETLLDTKNTSFLSTIDVSYTGTWSVSSDQTFNSTDLLVVKFRFNNQGAA